STRAGERWDPVTRVMARTVPAASLRGPAGGPRAAASQCPRGFGPTMRLGLPLAPGLDDPLRIGTARLGKGHAHGQPRLVALRGGGSDVLDVELGTAFSRRPRRLPGPGSPGIPASPGRPGTPGQHPGTSPWPAPQPRRPAGLAVTAAAARPASARSA